MSPHPTLHQLRRMTATTVTDNADEFAVTYHGTTVYRRTKATGTIVLDTGGHFTVTTKRRMNQAAYVDGINLHVSQADFTWHVNGVPWPKLAGFNRWTNRVRRFAAFHLSESGEPIAHE